MRGKPSSGKGSACNQEYPTLKENHGQTFQGDYPVPLQLSSAFMSHTIIEV
jgi:hypothetical protein